MILASRTGTSHTDDHGFHQAAILLRAIGEDQAARAAARLWPRDALRLGGAIAALGGVSARQMDAVVGAFLDAVGGATHYGAGASEYLKSIIDGPGAGTRTRPSNDVESSRRRRRATGLQWMSVAAIVRFVRRQPPNLQAMALAYLEPARAAEVVVALSPAERCCALLQLAAVPGACWAARERRAAAVGAEQLGGRPGVAAIVERLAESVREEVVAAIRATDPELADYLSG